MTAKYRALLNAAISCGDRDVAVLAVLQDYASSDGLTYVSDATIADLTGINRRTVLKSRKRLESRGLIVAVGRMTPRSGGREVTLWRVPSMSTPERESAHKEGRGMKEEGDGGHIGSGPGQPPATRSRHKPHPPGNPQDINCPGCRDDKSAAAVRTAATIDASRCPHGVPRGDVLNAEGVSTGGCIGCEGLEPGRPIDFAHLVKEIP